MICFGMVTTARSQRYTLPAIASFLRNTDLASDDRILLIDNDGGFELPRSLSRVELFRCDRPRSFSANVNHVIQAAAAEKADVVFLNNDMIFTPAWLHPLCVNDKAILIPMCNQNIHYQRGRLILRTTMDWEDYVGHEDDLDGISEAHRVDPQFRGTFWRPPRVSFYCFRLPYFVYAAVGMFDESFGVGGGEDIDYRLRTHLAGFDVAVAMESFVLHFMGKSTWASGETEQETRARDAIYVQRFRAKWGDELTQLFLFGENSHQCAVALGVETMMKEGDYRGVIRRFHRAV